MIPVVTKFLKHMGLVKKSICTDCKNSTSNLILCSHNPKITKNYLSGNTSTDYKASEKQNKNGNCPFFEEKL